MTEAEELQKIEGSLRAKRVTVSAFLLSAQVSSSAWHRIKTGTNRPNTATMDRIRAAHEKLKEWRDEK